MFIYIKNIIIIIKKKRYEMNIGLIGIGIMGSLIVRYFVKVGYILMVYNRIREKVEKFLDVVYVVLMIEELM